MKIDIEGLPGDRAFRSQIMGRMRRVLGRLPADSTSALVNFTDVNGPKGGVDMRCALTVSLPLRRSVHVEETATTRVMAFAAAVDALERGLRRRRERAATQRRRPKKYYVAGRLMQPEPGTLAPEGPPSTRRRRRAS